MKERNWTPGPWRVNGSLPGPICDECGADTISDDIGIWSKSAPIAAAIMDARQESNAHLIAAAPELYMVLEELHERLERCSQEPISAAEAYDSFYRDNVQDVLAKARGE